MTDVSITVTLDVSGRQVTVTVPDDMTDTELRDLACWVNSPVSGLGPYLAEQEPRLVIPA